MKRDRWRVDFMHRGPAGERVYSEARGVGVADPPGTLLNLATGLYACGASLRDPGAQRIVTAAIRLSGASVKPGSLTAAIAANPAAAADVLVRALGDVLLALDCVETESRRRGGATVDRVKLLEHIEAELHQGQRALRGLDG